MKLLKYLGVCILALVIIYLVGPNQQYEEFDNEPIKLNLALSELDQYIENNESKVLNIKEDNQSEIIWLDSIRKTEYAIVYLHGYTASKGEGEPIHKNMANKYGCNLYLPRLSKHGLTDEDAFMTITPKGLVESAKEAIAVGKLIGEKVILMGTSTGGTLAIYLAANEPSVQGLILMAPNIDIADQGSHLVNKPWGKQLMQIINGSAYRTWEADEDVQKYWTNKNRIEGVVALRELLDNTMTEDIFKRVNVPLCMIVYYKNEQQQDDVVSVLAMDSFVEKISTPQEQVVFKKDPNANCHPLGSKYTNENWMDVQVVVDDFFSRVIFSQGEKH
ncbi:MAG: esterase/lipase [Cyclobacteriaceae bacterium]|jgi:esterase/lipase